MDKNYKFFWVLAVLSIILIAIILVPSLNEALIGRIFMPVPFVLLSLVGGWLAWRLHQKGTKNKQEKFMLVTAYSALLILPFILLHNFIYALLEYFQPVFWNGADEPVFFILAVIGCPVGIIIGIIGTLLTGEK